MNAQQYYEKYWVQDSTDPTTNDREKLLLRTLKHYGHFAAGETKVLDAGCGSGEFLPFFVRAGFQVYGIDLSLVAVKRARNRSPKSIVIVGSLEGDLGFRPDNFELVWSTEVLEHLFDIEDALRAIHRVLKPGGLFVLTTPYHGLLKNLAIALTGFDRHFDVVGPHIRFFSKASLTRCLQAAGFDVLWITGFGRFRPLHKSMFVVATKRV